MKGTVNNTMKIKLKPKYIVATAQILVLILLIAGFKTNKISLLGPEMQFPVIEEPIEPDKVCLDYKIVKYEDGDSYTEYYTYDAQGKLVETLKVSQTGQAGTTKYILDSNGNILKELTTQDTNQENTNREYVYDNNGNLTQIKDYINNVYAQRFEYEYSKSGRITEKREYSHNGSLLSTTKYKYDSSQQESIPVEETKTVGNVQIVTTRDFKQLKDSGLYIETVTYPEQEGSEQISHIRNSDNKKVYYYSKTEGSEDEIYYQYDDNGNLIKSFGKLYGAEFTQNLSYLYDEEGNILLCEQSYNNRGNYSEQYVYSKLSEIYSERSQQSMG